MNLRWLLMAKRLIQNPPSKGRVKFVAAIALFCIGLYAIEQVWGWPEWLTPNNTRVRIR